MNYDEINRPLSEVKVTVGANVASQQGHTGRTVTIDSDSASARSWFNCQDEAGFRADAKATRFKQELSKLDGTVMTVFRGRVLDEPRWQNMGPAPAKLGDSTEGNRYNRHNRPVLYLSDSKRGVAAEMTPVKSGKALFIQMYRIDPQELRLADCSSPDCSNFVKSVFECAETCKILERQGPDNYLFSQVIAELVEEAGFEGMVIPGVRGSRPHWYKNIVVFDPHSHSRWEQWVRRDRPVQRWRPPKRFQSGGVHG